VDPGVRERSPDRGLASVPGQVKSTVKRLPGLIEDLTLVTVEGGPHNIGWTHPDEVNTVLLDFLAR